MRDVRDFFMPPRNPNVDNSTTERKSFLSEEFLSEHATVPQSGTLVRIAERWNYGI